jgi:hypothetical protein
MRPCLTLFILKVLNTKRTIRHKNRVNRYAKIVLYSGKLKRTRKLCLRIIIEGDGNRPGFGSKLSVEQLGISRTKAGIIGQFIGAFPCATGEDEKQLPFLALIGLELQGCQVVKPDSPSWLQRERH